MHQAWLTDDIWKLLLEHLQPTDLARLAQTCSTLFELATDQLWHTITRPEALIACLPEEHATRPLQPSDLDRLGFYSAKIQVLNFYCKIDKRPVLIPQPFRRGWPSKKEAVKGKTWTYLWNEIENLRPTNRFLPNLRKLRMNNADERLLEALCGISGRRLEEVYVKYLNHGQRESLVRRFLDSLSDVSSLDYLLVRDGGDVVPSWIFEKAPLRHLRFDSRVTANIWHEKGHSRKLPLRPEILNMNSLQNLTISLTEKWYTEDLRLTERKYLPNLKTLYLDLIVLPSEAYHRENLCPSTLLSALDRPRLQFLSIRFRHDATAPQIQRVLAAAKHACDLSQLTTLRILGGCGKVVHCPDCVRSPNWILTPSQVHDALLTILPLPNLKSLTYKPAPGFLDTLDLTRYEEIATQLPALESLDIGFDVYRPGPGRYNAYIKYEDAMALHHVAAFCHSLPHLREVSIGDIDADALEHTPDSSWRSPGVTLFTARRAERKLVEGTQWTAELQQWRDDDDGESETDGLRAPSPFGTDLFVRGVRTYFPNGWREGGGS